MNSSTPGQSPLPAYVVRQSLASGALLPVLDKYPMQETWFKAYVPRRRQRVARVAALIAWLSEHLESTSWHPA